jgi:hypothetical protein
MTNPMFEKNRQIFSSGIDEPMEISALAKASAQPEARDAGAGHKRDCAYEELSLEEALADPIVQQVMRSDGITASDMRALIQQAREKL